MTPLFLLAAWSLLVILHGWLESSLTMHMAIQIPLLILVGGLLADSLRQGNEKLNRFGRRYSVSLLLFALFTFGLWMLPLSLDVALHNILVDALKWLSLPLAGFALVLSWRHLPFVLRGLLHLEALATLLRIGWLYLIAPQRYCVSYLIDEQKTLAYVLLGYAAAYALYLAARLMIGGHPTHNWHNWSQSKN